VEGLGGLHIWIFAGSKMQRFLNSEGDVVDVNYPSPFTTVQANGCVHTSYPDTIFVAGEAVGGTTAFGLRKYQTTTGQWQTQSLNVTKPRKCYFTPDGYFIFLVSTTAVHYYSMTENTMTLFYTGTVTSLYFDTDSNYVLLALQAQRIDKVPFVVEDARNCGPGKFNLEGGLQSEAMCRPCLPGHVCPSGNRITPCAKGTYSSLEGMREQGQCTLCPAGHFCLGGTSIELCPLGSYSLATGLTRQADCSPCPTGFYCTNTTVITACPTNTMSPMGSSDLAACSCNSGYSCEVTTVVHAEVVLPITVVDFEALREQYILAVALAAGVDPSQVVIVSVTSAAGASRRRLLATESAPRYAEIHTSIYNSKYNDKPHMALRGLQRRLAERGLPPHQPDMRITLHREVQRATKAIQNVMGSI
jgi:hypothetical protein